ncbi:hypothetical protein HF882_08935 [Victivallis vadensis]|uniref:BRCT domain-containing protein n=1 Tax=Victivallis vadensis TaxID=172901 RepID=A0A848B1H2_9BACT|nr:hypothetical protein [Victivallis vadensis]NMD86706.1 hypothetical protein [Victivallis vadensis]
MNYYGKVDDTRVEITDDIKSALREYINEHTQKALAKEINTTPGTIRQWLDGSTTSISPACWNNLYDLLGNRILQIAYANEIHKERMQFAHVHEMLGEDPERSIASIGAIKLTYEKAISELQGIALLATSTQRIIPANIIAILKWLENNIHFRDKWPIREVYELYQQLINEPYITEEWATQLYNLLDEVKTGHPVVKLDFDLVSRNSIQGKYVMITGDFSNGMSRDEVGKLIEKNGGIYDTGKKPSYQTDIVIVGERGSAAWRFSGYGRKIEQAIELRKKYSYCPKFCETHL